MRRAPNIDREQRLIVSALLAAGASVQTLAAVGLGCPDLLVGYRGVNYLLEVKSPVGPRGGDQRDAQCPNAYQRTWHRAWRGNVVVVRSLDEALAAIGAKRDAHGGASDLAAAGNVARSGDPVLVDSMHVREG